RGRGWGETEGNHSGSIGIGVRIQNRLPQATQSRVVRFEHRKRVGPRTKTNPEKDPESDSEPRRSAHLSLRSSGWRRLFRVEWSRQARRCPRAFLIGNTPLRWE